MSMQKGKNLIGHRNSLEVANYFLKKKIAFTPIKLIKIIYIAHGWFMAVHGKDMPLIRDDVQAWKHGPVIPNVFHAFKEFGWSKIDETLFGVRDGSDFHLEEKKLINTVAEKYGQLSGQDLSDMTHVKGTPWYDIYDGTLYRVIPNEKIYDYYREKMDSYKKKKGISRAV